MVAALGGHEPTICIAVDVSGRHHGIAQLSWFLFLLLGTSEVVVQDDYTNHPWHLSEAKIGPKIQGHHFF